MKKEPCKNCHHPIHLCKHTNEWAHVLIKKISHGCIVRVPSKEPTKVIKWVPCGCQKPEPKR